MNILQEPDKLLHIPSSKVTDFVEAKKIVEELIEVTKKVDKPWKPWLGMAAPQIGENKQILLLKTSFHQYKVIINPEIIKQKWLFPLPCMCYSLERRIYLTRYHFWFKIKYQDIDGECHTEIIQGGTAAGLQQELDHINGIMLSDIGFRIF